MGNINNGDVGIALYNFFIDKLEKSDVDTSQDWWSFSYTFKDNEVVTVDAIDTGDNPYKNTFPIESIDLNAYQNYIPYLKPKIEESWYVQLSSDGYVSTSYD